MRRFRFEVVSPEYFPDPDGVLLRNLEDAKREALRLGAALIRDYPEAFAKPGPWLMQVLDDAGDVLAELELGPRARAQSRALNLSPSLAPPLDAGDRLGSWTFSGGQLYLNKRPTKKG